MTTYQEVDSMLREYFKKVDNQHRRIESWPTAKNEIKKGLEAICSQSSGRLIVCDDYSASIGILEKTEFSFTAVGSGVPEESTHTHFGFAILFSLQFTGYISVKFDYPNYIGSGVESRKYSFDHRYDDQDPLEITDDKAVTICQHLIGLIASKVI